MPDVSCLPCDRCRTLTDVYLDVDGRLCQALPGGISCCLPCPMTDWVYPESFKTITIVANWVAAVSVICCAFLLISWAFLPVEKTNRHYLSICLTFGVLLMNVSSINRTDTLVEEKYADRD